MQIQVVQHDGSAITVDMIEYDVLSVASILNNQNLIVVAFGDLIINRNSIQMVVPIDMTEGNVKISLHNGINITAHDTKYNVVTLANEINNNQNQSMVTIGDVIINKTAIKTISPIT